MNALRPASRNPGSIRPHAMRAGIPLPATAMVSLTPRTRAKPQAIAGLAWSNVPGAAVAVASAPDGSLWALSTGPSGPDKAIWHYSGGTWANIPGAASAIAVAPDGALWAVNAEGGIYEYQNGAWSGVGGGAKAIAAGEDGTVYVLSNGNIQNGDSAVWMYASGTWSQLPGAGSIIAGSRDEADYTIPGVGTIAHDGFFVVTAAGAIYYYSPGSGYVQFAGAASAIGPVPGGFLVGAYPAGATGSQVYFYDLTNPGWTAEAGAAVSLAATASQLYVTSSGNGIWFAPITLVRNEPSVAGCQIFPGNNPWNTNIANAPLDPNSANYMAEMNPNGTTNLHPDFGPPPYGIPFNVVNPPAPAEYTSFVWNAYPDQSDPGPYPIPANPQIENGSDAHMLVIDGATCRLYETWQTYESGGTWYAGNGAIFDLQSNALRPDGWTSADAAGLPIFAGLANYDEAQAGTLNHALRFTMSNTTGGYIHPATHDAQTSNNQWAPPMGLRLRLKASFDTGGYTGMSLVILNTLKNYGMMLADNGSNFFITGTEDSRWDNNDLNQLKTVPASAFEVVQTGTIQH